MKSLIKLNLNLNYITDYINCSKIINFDNPNIQSKAKEIKSQSTNKLAIIKSSFEFVRDQIRHSVDVNEEKVTCKASEVLKYEHGICYAKAHLLAALLRVNNIPAGLCYQKLILNDENPHVFCLHGLNAVYINEIDKWIRLDARGNKPGVNAEFNLEKEQLAFDVRTNLGEEDYLIIYHEPLPAVVNCLSIYKTTEELFVNLPREIGV
ncbi:MAG: transglutaminase family protein [Candidatus Margulisiibacteriota bacterium]|jgi:transglutaminase-like putative cysteine protease